MSERSVEECIAWLDFTGMANPVSSRTATIAHLRRLQALEGALKRIGDDDLGPFNQMRGEDEDDTDYFLRCFRAVKEAARRALEQS